MAQDPVLRLARLQIIKASADLDAELATKTGSKPTLEILRRLRERAAQSLAALAFVSPIESAKITALQNEVKRYDEWVGWIRDIISEGILYDKEFTDDEREEMLDVLTGTPEGQREAIELGLLDETTSRGDG